MRFSFLLASTLLFSLASQNLGGSTKLDNVSESSRSPWESISYDQSLLYLKCIERNGADLLSLANRFRQSDAVGSSAVFKYPKIGYLSTETLRSLKIVADLREEFGAELQGMHILQIGPDTANLCKVIREAVGFASYTFVGEDKHLELVKNLATLDVKNVHFLTYEQLFSADNKYDLVISNYAFSYLDAEQQQRCFEVILHRVKHGYMTLCTAQKKGLSLDEIILGLYCHRRRGVVTKESPNLDAGNRLVVFSECGSKESVVKPATTTACGSGISYRFSGGRLGDNLMAYFHAKWLAMKYGLPLYYHPFPNAEQFHLFENDLPKKGTRFAYTVVVNSERDIVPTARSTLFEVPYFPDHIEHFYPNGVRTTTYPPFKTHWHDPLFWAVVKRSLSPRRAVHLPSIPSDYIKVGIHVRTASLPFDPPDYVYEVMPSKFPPKNYYVEQLLWLSKMLKNPKMYVYVLTDGAEPEEIKAMFQQAFADNKEMIFDCCKKNHDLNLIEDFTVIADLDCLIIPQSNFSNVASKLGVYAFVVATADKSATHKEIVIDDLKITFDGSKQLLR